VTYADCEFLPDRKIPESGAVVRWCDGCGAAVIMRVEGVSSLLACAHDARCDEKEKKADAIA